MTSSGFEDFAQALTRNRAQAPARHKGQPAGRVAVLGAAPDGQMYAALALAGGAEVRLFSAYGAELAAIRAAGSITLRGEGPVGSFHVDQPAGPSIQTTAALDEALDGAELVVLSGPLHKQRTYAQVLADQLAAGQVVLLPDARSLGAVEVAWLLQCGGAQADLALVEAGGAPYWITADGGALVLSACPPVPLASLAPGQDAALAAVSGLMPNGRAVLSCVHSGFDDASAAVELPALMIGGPAAADGAPLVPEGGVPLAGNATFRALIGPAHEALIARLWDERCAVAADFGVRDLPDVGGAIDRVAGAARGTGSRPVPDAAASREAVRAGVVGSLVPLVSAAARSGRAVPATQAMIELAQVLLKRDLGGAGRRLETIGISAGDVSDARRQFAAILNGGVHG
ncbi:MAG: hypothetical protein JJU19_15155 [Pararhodobacter sp.]|nr:hypothetical protein [Pararhodobacter sp.]